MWFEGFRHSLFVNQIATFGNFNERSPSQKSNEFLGSKSFREMYVTLTVISGEFNVNWVSSNPTVPECFQLKKYALHKNALVSHLFLNISDIWKKNFIVQYLVKMSEKKKRSVLSPEVGSTVSWWLARSNESQVYYILTPRAQYRSTSIFFLNFDWTKSWSTTQFISAST